MNNWLWLLGLMLLLVCISCRSKKVSAGNIQEKQKSSDDRLSSMIQGSTEELRIGSLHVVDISRPGARLSGLKRDINSAILVQGNGPHLVIDPEMDAPMTLEILNTCGGTGCQIIANATFGFPGEEGLRHRFQAADYVPIDGIRYEPVLEKLSLSIRRALFAQIKALSIGEKELGEWLLSGNRHHRDAAFQAVVTRQMVGLAPQLEQLLVDPDKKVVMRAIAVSGVLEDERLVASLGKLAMGKDPDIADAAVQALADVDSNEAIAQLKLVVDGAPLLPIRDLAKELLMRSDRSSSPSVRSSDKAIP